MFKTIAFSSITCGKTLSCYKTFSSMTRYFGGLLELAESKVAVKVASEKDMVPTLDLIGTTSI